MTTAALAFGNLNFELTDAPVGVLASGVPWIAALGKDVDRGNPEAVVAKIASMLMDGDKAEVTRYGNQIVRYPIEISGDDLDVVAAGEALVMAEVNRGRNTATWTPPGPAETNVHDVVYSTLEFHFDDLSENRAVRYFTLVLECVPFARPLEPTVVVAEPIPDEPAVWTTIDDCTSLTGWSGTSGPLSVVGGESIKWVPDSPVMEMWSWAISARIKRSGLAVPLLDGDYVIVDVAGSWDGMTYGFNDDGLAYAPVAVESLGVERNRLYFRVAHDTLTTVQFRVLIQNRPTGYVQVFDVSKADQLPFIGTLAQRSFTVEIGGTARTQADLVIEGDGGIDLGNELVVYSAPVGTVMEPALRKWLAASSTVTPDDSAVSGARTGFTTMSEFNFPVPAAGTYLLMGRLRATAGSPTTTVSYALSNATTTYAAPTDTETGQKLVSLTTSWEIHELGVVTLPTTRVANGTPTVQYLSVWADSSAAVWDEFWLFNIDEKVGSLSWWSDLHVSTQKPSRAVARSASLASPRPSWLVGQAGDPSFDVDVSRRMRAPGVHEFRPGLMFVFVVSTHAVAKVWVEAYDRFMHHVTKKAA